MTEGIPTTRWGHAAATHEGKLYIIGGRNEQDVCDLHEFDPSTMKWREIEPADPKPKPRRRHSAVFISGTLVMFGGFDGSFFNDVNILDIQSSNRSAIKVPQSEICKDYLSLVNNPDGADVVFIINDAAKSIVFAHRALILFRLLSRELNIDDKENMPLLTILAQSTQSDFLRKLVTTQGT